MNKKNKKFLIFILTGFILTALPLASMAMTVKTGGNIIVDEEIKGNFFGAGNVIVIDGTVNGDVFVAGESVDIKGTINGDVFAAGSRIDVSGTINGNLRAAGSDIKIMGRVERNVLAGTANLIVEDTASIGGNITCGSANLILQGPVGGEVIVASRDVVLNSSIGGDVNVFLGAENKQGKLSILDKAVILGNLSYKALSEAEIKPGAQISGKTDYSPLVVSAVDKKEKSKELFQKANWVFQGFSFFCLFLAGLILIYFLPKVTDRIYGMMKEKPWSDLGIGVMAIIITPILGLFLFFTVISIPLVLAAWALFMIAIYFAKTMVAIAIGRWLAERFKWNWHKVFVLIVGLVVFLVINMVPFIGSMFSFLAILLSLGALLRIKLQIIKELR